MPNFVSTANVMKKTAGRTRNTPKNMTAALPLKWKRGTAVIVYALLACAVIAVDLWSKWFVFNTLDEKEVRTLIPGMIFLQRALNPGAAFSFGSGFGLVFIILAIIASGIMTWVVVKHGPRSRLLTLSLGLLTGGALGNVYDRIFCGGLVRDFIDWWIFGWHYPAIFNVADMAICVGCGLMVIYSFLSPVKLQESETSRSKRAPSRIRFKNAKK
jgi:signal peptidase II